MTTRPGNHDCHLALEAADLLKCEPTASQGEKITILNRGIRNAREQFPSLSFLNFRDFARSVSTADYWESYEGQWIDTRFVDLGLLFFGLNSARYISVESMKSAKIDIESASDLSVKLGQIDSSGRFMRVGLVHNPPDPEGGAGTDSSYVEPTKLFQALSFDHLRPDLWLHGHVHEFGSREWRGRKDLSTVVVGAAAPRNPTTKQQLDERRGFSLIEVCPKDTVSDTPSMKVISFDYHSAKVRKTQEARYIKGSRGWEEE